MPAADSYGDRPVGRLLRLAEASDPQHVVEILNQSVKEFGGRDATLQLVDFDHTQLKEDLGHSGGVPEALSVGIDSSMAGRAFLTGDAQVSEREEGFKIWVPVADRSDRLGVLSLTMPAWNDRVAEVCEELAIVAAHLVRISSSYTDRYSLLRRRKDMSLAAEMQWQLLPPLSFAAGRATLSGLLEPAYHVGGDCFDYSLNSSRLDFAVFDAMGHGLKSAMLSNLAVSSYRHARRQGDWPSLPQLLESVDRDIFDHSEGDAFVTAVFGRLNIQTGVLSWASAGHPRPLRFRRGSKIDSQKVDGLLPLGLGPVDPNRAAANAEVVTETLQPGDSILLYTDGVIDARDAHGEYFGVERLADQVEREMTSGLASAEVLRRVVLARLSHQREELRDDASMLFLHWGDE